MTSQVGTLLNGRYRLDAQIGHGGMSTVYRAFDTVLERQVAIKLMHREIASDSDQLERFRREARAVAQLNHPHVVGVIDAGEEGTASPSPSATGRSQRRSNTPTSWRLTSAGFDIGPRRLKMVRLGASSLRGPATLRMAL